MHARPGSSSVQVRSGRMGTRHVHDAQIAVVIFISSARRDTRARYSRVRRGSSPAVPD